MCELLIAKYEKENGQAWREKRRWSCQGVFMLAALLFLMANSIGIQSAALRTGANMAVFAAVLVVFFFPHRLRGWEGEDIEEYMGQLDCMERILRGLDIDDYNKLGLVMDGVKMRLDNEEKQQCRRERIFVLILFSLATVFFASSLCWGRGVLPDLSWDWMLNGFLVLAVMFMLWVHVLSGVCSVHGKIKWLYRILMHVMVNRM